MSKVQADTTFSQFQTRQRRERNDSPSQRQFFQFLAMPDERGKIGTVIKRLPSIRKTAGGGVFINYKRQIDADNLSTWLAENPKVLPVRSQGPGFYIWAYNKDAALRAKIYLQDAERRYDESQRKYQKERPKQQSSNPFDVLGDEKAVASVEDRVPRPKPKVVEELAAPEKTFDEEFPSLPAKSAPAPVQGAWVQGKPKEAEPEVVQTQPPQTMTVLPKPIIVKKASAVPSVPEAWDAWEDETPEHWDD